MAFERFNELDAETQNYINAARTRARVDPSAMQAALNKYNEGIAALDAPAPQPAAPAQPEITSPGFTLNDLKNPAYWYRVGNQQKNVYSLIYNINGQQYTFLPTDYIQKGFRDGNTQYVDKAFLNKDTLNTIFQEGVGVDLDGVAAGWALNGLKNTGFDTKGVLVPSSVLSSAGVGSPVNYQIDNSRNGGAVKGLTEYNGQYIYAQDLTGDRAKASYIDAAGNRKAEFTKVRGGFLGNLIVDVAEGFASVPGLPEIVSAVTGGNPLVYASLKGLQTAGAGGELPDVIKSGLTAWASKGGLAPIDPTLNKIVQTAMVVDNSKDPVEAAAKLVFDPKLVDAVTSDNPLKELALAYGEDLLKASGASDVIEAALADVVGDKIANAIKENPTVVSTALDVAKGKDLSEAIVDNLTDDIIEASGAETDNEKALVAAALKGAEAADQGGDILGSAAEEYYAQGGDLGDLGDIDSDLLGDVDFGIVDAIKDGLTAAGDVIANVADPIKDAVIEGGDVLADVAEPAKDALIDVGDAIADVPVDLDPLDVAQNVSEGLAQLEDDIVAGGDVVADLAEPLKNEIINLGDEIADAGSALDDLVSENLPEFDVPELPELPELPEVALETPELPDLPEFDVPELPSVQLPTLDLMKFAGLLGGLTALSGQTAGGQVPKDELGRSAYATSPQFARGLDPLGTIGMFSRNKA
jgi:hypothetical protein